MKLVIRSLAPGVYFTQVQCPEHGLALATWKRDPRMRVGGSFQCRVCARLNFKAWEVVNKQRNRARVAEWHRKSKKEVA